MSTAEVLTSQEAAHYLRLSLSKVRQLIRTGELPAVRIGRAWRLRRSTLDRWLDDREETQRLAARDTAILNEVPEPDRPQAQQLLARIRHIERECRETHGEFDWDLLPHPLRDEYDGCRVDLNRLRQTSEPARTLAEFRASEGDGGG